MCIFPEGQITRDGETGVFRPGVSRILERTPVPVVPLALSGLWKSIFSRNRDIRLHAAKLFPRVRLSVGEAIDPASVTPEGLRNAVIGLRGKYSQAGAATAVRLAQFLS